MARYVKASDVLNQKFRAAPRPAFPAAESLGCYVPSLFPKKLFTRDILPLKVVDVMDVLKLANRSDDWLYAALGLVFSPELWRVPGAVIPWLHADLLNLALSNLLENATDAEAAKATGRIVGQVVAALRGLASTYGTPIQGDYETQVEDAGLKAHGAVYRANRGRFEHGWEFVAHWSVMLAAGNAAWIRTANVLDTVVMGIHAADLSAFHEDMSFSSHTSTDLTASRKAVIRDFLGHVRVIVTEKS